MLHSRTNIVDEAMDNLFNIAFGLNGKIDYEVNENECMFALPGFSKEDLKIEVEGRILSISAEIDKASENHFRKSFSKRYTLGNYYEIDKISAKMEHGILTLSFGKTTETKKVTIL